MTEKLRFLMTANKPSTYKGFRPCPLAHLVDCERTAAGIEEGRLL
jgi:hypothetical protein